MGLDVYTPLFSFNKAIIDATAPYAVAYKPNTAFYEAYGTAGWRELEKTVNYLRKRYPDIFLIADAKRGDIGNTGKQYAKAFFDTFDFDAVTLAPYMGRDSVAPFLEYPEKWVILLALTSNPSATDFEMQELSNGRPLYEQIIRESMQWAGPDRMMYVVGATRPEVLGQIRQYAPEHFFLVPGVGAQGGSLTQVCRYGLNARCGLLVNLSRSILYVDTTENFARGAARKAAEVAARMADFLQ